MIKEELSSFSVHSINVFFVLFFPSVLVVHLLVNNLKSSFTILISIISWHIIFFIISRCSFIFFIYLFCFFIHCLLKISFLSFCSNRSFFRRSSWLLFWLLFFFILFCKFICSLSVFSIIFLNFKFFFRWSWCSWSCWLCLS